MIRYTAILSSPIPLGSFSTLRPFLDSDLPQEITFRLYQRLLLVLKGVLPGACQMGEGILFMYVKQSFYCGLLLDE